MSTDPEIKKYLESLGHKDFRLNLEPMREACALLNNPQDTFASIHIVGTNGKGSTAAFLKSLLMASGYAVGLMTSPHLIDFRERIQINQNWITWEALAAMVQSIRSILPEEDFLSYFEMLTLVGFEYFSKIGVDVAVVEAGMGGRFDATNVLKPQVAIITPISIDHETYLGHTIEKIAKEKCGVFKSEMTVISAPQPQAARTVIEMTCKQLNLPLLWANPETISMPLGLHGTHQKINAACAIEAVKALIGDDVIDAIAPQALKNTYWPGRLDYLSKNPTLLVDGAHNPGGIETLRDHLILNHSRQKIFFLIGMLKDKNLHEMITPLLSLADHFICVKPKTPRALPAETLAEKILSFGKKVTVKTDPIREILYDLLPQLTGDQMLVATGSLYVVGECVSCFHKPD